MTDLDKLAKSLTKAQRRQIMRQGWDGESTVVLRNLLSKGIFRIEEDPPGSKWGFARLTDLGLALRNHLRGQNDG